MADETLNIIVDDGGSTAKVTNNLRDMATTADKAAVSQDSLTSATSNATSALNQEAEAASKTADSTTKAATAVKGYVDAQGNYIRIVGSNKGITQEQITAQQALTSQLSATSIEAGRAAAGYGPLNSGLSASQAAAAASRASIAALTEGLARGATSAQAAGVGLNQVGAAGNAAAVGMNNGRNAFTGAGAGLAAVGAAGQAAAAGFSAAGGGAGSALPPITGLGAASRAAAAAANDNSAAHRSLGAAFQQVGSAASSFGSILAGLGLAVGAQQVIKYADSYSSVQNKLRLITTDQAKLNDIMNLAFNIAQKTSTPLDAIAGLYGKISQSANQYRLSASDVGKVTESMALAFQVSGASSADAASAINQFTQGLQKGVVQAQDFRIILERAPAVQNAMIAGLRMIGVTVNGSLTEALSKGTITAKQMLNALVAINPTLNDFASGALPTVSQAMTRVSNAFEMYIGKANEGNSVTGTLINTLNAVANNMNTVVPIAITLGGLLAFGMVAGAVASILRLAAAFVTLSTAMAANPAVLIALGAALAVGVPLWLKYGDSIKSAAANMIQQAGAAGQAQQANTATAASAGQLGQAYATAQANLTAANAEVARTKAAMDSAKAGTDAHSQAVKDNNAALQSAASAASVAETARKALENQTQANAKAEKTFADSLNHIKNENAYGEKLQSFSDFINKAREAQEKWQKSLDATLKPLNDSATATNKATIAASGFSDAAIKAAEAAQGIATGFDQFGTRAAHVAEQLKAVTGDAGLFTEEQLRANSSINEGQRAADSAAGSISKLGDAYRQAGNDAEFFAINSKDANTVSGQIGGGTVSGLNGNDWGGLAMGINIPNSLSPSQVQQLLVSNATNILKVDPTNQAAIDYLQHIKQSEQAVKDLNGNSSNASASSASSSASTVSNAINANTAAVNANTAATSTNTTATTTLPDLLLPSNDNGSASTASAGLVGVGSSVTQTTYGYGGTSAANGTTASAAASNGVGVGMLPDGSLAPGITTNATNYHGPILDPATVSGPSPDIINRQNQADALAALAAALGQKTQPRTPVVNITVKSDDYGQFKRSERQIAQDIGVRVNNALAG